MTNIYSTPADVQALIDIMNKLQLPTQQVVVQYSGGAWDTKGNLPVDAANLPTRDIFSLQIGNQTNDINVGATLGQMRFLRDVVKWPALMRGWYLWQQITGREDVDPAGFKAMMADTLLEGVVENILGGK